MTASLAFMASFKNGQGLSDTQEFALGEIGQDKIGQRWSYVRFERNVTAGQWIADYRSGGTGVVTYPTDTDDLWFVVARSTLDAGGDLPFEYLVGTYGTIGDYGFVVVGCEALENDANVRVQVRLLHDNDTVFTGDSEWPATPPSTGNIEFFMPGRASVTAKGVPNDVRGVVQRTITGITAGTPHTHRYGWVLQKGVGLCLISGTAADFTASHRFLHPAPVARYGRFATQSARDGTTGARILGVPTLSDLVLAEIDIENNATSPFGRRPKRPIGAGGTVVR